MGWVFQRVHLYPQDTSAESPRYLLKGLSPRPLSVWGLRYSSESPGALSFKIHLQGSFGQGKKEKIKKKTLDFFLIYVSMFKSTDRGYRSIIVGAAQGWWFVITFHSQTHEGLLKKEA